MVNQYGWSCQFQVETKASFKVSLLALNADEQHDFNCGDRWSVSPGAPGAFRIECNVRDNFLGSEILCMGFGCQESCSGGYCCPGGKTKCTVQCLPRGQRLPWKKRALLLEVSCSSLEAALVWAAPLMNNLPWRHLLPAFEICAIMLLEILPWGTIILLQSLKAVHLHNNRNPALEAWMSKITSVAWL